MSLKQRHFQALRNHKQQGFLIPLAIFILVVMSMFALVLSRNTTLMSASPTLELMTLQAFYAAESGSSRGMKRLFFPIASVRSGVDDRCALMNISDTFTVPGLKLCSVAVTCTCAYTDTSVCQAGTPANYLPATPVGQLTSFYRITSVATCGTGNYRAVRTIETGAMMKQE